MRLSISIARTLDTCREFLYNLLFIHAALIYVRSYNSFELNICPVLEKAFLGMPRGNFFRFHPLNLKDELITFSLRVTVSAFTQTWRCAVSGSGTYF